MPPRGRAAGRSSSSTPAMAAAIPARAACRAQVREKDLTLALARELRDLLVKRGRVRVAMTRDDDRYLTLDDRAAVARRLDAAMFVSLHIDSAANPLARGASVYSLSDVASDAEAARARGASRIAARRQRRGNGIGRRDARRPRDARADERSADLAARLVGKAAGRFELRPNPHRFAAFHVLAPRRTRRRCCSRPAISAMPTTRRCCAIAEHRAQDRAGAGRGDRSRCCRAFAPTR